MSIIRSNRASKLERKPFFHIFYDRFFLGFLFVIFRPDKNFQNSRLTRLCSFVFQVLGSSFTKPMSQLDFSLVLRKKPFIRPGHRNASSAYNSESTTVTRALSPSSCSFLPCNGLPVCLLIFTYCNNMLINPKKIERERINTFCQESSSTSDEKVLAPKELRDPNAITVIRRRRTGSGILAVHREGRP